MSLNAQRFTEDRKVEERAAYEKLYGAGQANADPDFRSLFLNDSETAFNRRLVELAAEKTVLEIGCGDGSHAILAAQNGARQVIGVDIAEEGIKLAAERAKQAGVGANTEFIQADVEKLPFPDESFDLIVNHEVFSSIDLTKVLPELARVLRPGGRLLCKESLGHNPLFNLNRTISRLRGRRTGWAVSHIWRFDDFVLAAKYFRVLSAESYHLFVLFAAPVAVLPWVKVKKIVASAASAVDRKLMKIPALRPHAFKLIFELEKRS